MRRYELINTQFKSIFYYFISFCLGGVFVRFFRILGFFFGILEIKIRAAKPVERGSQHGLYIHFCLALSAGFLAFRALKTFGNPLERSM